MPGVGVGELGAGGSGVVGGRDTDWLSLVIVEAPYIIL